MRVLLHDEEDIELRDFGAPGFTVEHVGAHEYSALQMFATSLGLCTFSILVGYAEQIGLSADNIQIRVRWSYANQPYRIAQVDMAIRWPQLPPSRLKAAQRAASHCALHHTLQNPPAVHTVVER